MKSLHPRSTGLGRKCGLSLLIAVLFAAAWEGSEPKIAHAQNTSGSGEVSFPTRDKITLIGDYFESNGGKESPVVVLLHGEGSNRLVWDKGFCDRLQRAGYALITVDLRGHGQSNPDNNDNQRRSGRGRRNANKLKPSDYKKMVFDDMEAIKEFIFKEHQAEKLNMNKTAIIGSEMGAAVAVSFAGNDWIRKPYPDGPPGHQTPRGQDVRALVLLTPVKISGLPYPQPLKFLRDPKFEIAFMIGVGTRNKSERAEAERIRDMITHTAQTRQKTVFQLYPGGLRGADLLSRKDVGAQDQVLEFLDEHLKKLPPNWRDRKSKLSADK